MAGKGHHTLPRFLQKGWAHEIKGDEVRNWLCRRDNLPPKAPTNTVNIGKENYFYGKSGDINADPTISDLEQTHAPIVNRLRDLTNGARATDSRIPEIVTSLTLRSASLRASMTELMCEALRAAKGSDADWALTLDDEIRQRYPYASRESSIGRKRNSPRWLQNECGGSEKPQSKP